MKVFIVLLLGLAAAQADKIVGGTAAGAAIPYQVRIGYSSGSIRCGASLISSNWVVSAAHCKGTLPSQWESWHIVVGYYDGVGDNSQTTTVSNQIFNENYDSTTTDNDIMVLQLSSSLTINSDVALVGLPSQGSENLISGDPCIVSGWGTTEYQGSSASTLQEVTVNYVTNADCNARLAYNGDISENMLCLAASGKDACQGDSGGPAVCNNILEGIVSWGYGCADPKYPGVYTRVSQYRDWITQNSGV